MSNIIKKEQQITNVLPQEKYALAKAMVAKGANDTEFQMLVHIANKYQLDPLLKEIWCIKRNANDPALIMTSRDGYLSIAHKSGQFDGMQSGTVEENGVLVKAWAEVWRKDMSHSFKAEVKYSEYKQNSPVWSKYPSAMLIKVAEVFALKRAFSISGMVTQEEMAIEEHEPKIEQIDLDTEELKAKAYELAQTMGLDIDTFKEGFKSRYLVDIESAKSETLNTCINSMQAKLKEVKNGR
jgi:phage recombination protein Bet